MPCLLNYRIGHADWRTASFGAAYGPRFQSGTNYIGFKFHNASAGALNYGWAEVNIGSLDVVQWAYENTGAPIMVGAVPEPSALALLAAGAAGLLAYRRRPGSPEPQRQERTQPTG